MNAIETKLHNDLLKNEAAGFILGLNRIPEPECLRLSSHIYRGTFNEVGDPMCPRGWNRGEDGYSIWRNNIGKGICRTCLKAAAKEYHPAPNNLL
jgi:hypothetical protein